MIKKYPWDKDIYIIAEAGVNHNGNFDLAKKMVREAKKAGANAIKFQTWVEGELTGRYTKKIGYVKRNFKTRLSRYEISNKLALDFNKFVKLKKYCKKIKIDFLTTPCGKQSLDFIVNILKVKYIKIGSSELNNLEYLKEVGKKNKPVFFSSGMGSLDEVKKAFNAIKKYNKFPIIVFQCTSQYPCLSENVNLRVINKFKKLFPIVGFSDHSLGYEAAIAAVGLGVKVIEKHFTLNKNFKGPDHKASLDVKELNQFIKILKNTNIMMGSSIKRPTQEEKKIMPQTRRGLVARSDLKKGTILKKKHIDLKRPSTGLQPNEFRKAINRKLKINLKKDQPIKKSYFK
jgi:N-acetylneuraminate synthase/N,N'-diacetyllegionaminate synthase